MAGRCVMSQARGGRTLAPTSLAGGSGGVSCLRNKPVWEYFVLIHAGLWKTFGKSRKVSDVTPPPRNLSRCLRTVPLECVCTHVWQSCICRTPATGLSRGGRGSPTSWGCYLSRTRRCHGSAGGVSTAWSGSTTQVPAAGCRRRPPMGMDQPPGRLHWGGHREDVSLRRTQIVLARPLEGMSFLCFWKVPTPVERRENSREEAPRAAGGSETIHKAFLALRDTLPTGPHSWRGAAFSQKHTITFPYLYAGGGPWANGGVLTEARESSSASPLSHLDTNPTARSPPSPPPGGSLVTLGVPPSA